MAPPVSVALNEQLKKSLPTRGTAVGFCLLVLFGNLWIGFAMINAKPPVWVSYGFGLGLITVAVFGLAFGCLAVYWRLRPPAALIAPVEPNEEPHD